MLSRAQNRLYKELGNIKVVHPEFEVVLPDPDDIMLWHVNFIGGDSTLYAGERYTLQFKFDDTYPFEGPEVTFTGTVPVHEHVYSNGYICLSTLYEWTPNLNVSVLVLSIVSMLSSAEIRSPPANDAEIVNEYSDIGPKEIDWEFEDTRC